MRWEEEDDEREWECKDEDEDEAPAGQGRTLSKLTSVATVVFLILLGAFVLYMLGRFFTALAN